MQGSSKAIKDGSSTGRLKQQGKTKGGRCGRGPHSDRVSSI